MKLRFLVASILLSQFTHAHPVSFKGANSVMIYQLGDFKDWTMHHSFSPRWSLGARFLEMRGEMEASDRAMQSALVQGSRLLKRWNRAESQGNVYLSLGAGARGVGEPSHSAGLVAIDADWETRGVYVAAKYHALFAEKAEPWRMTQLRAGFAPYLSEYEELATWFILEWRVEEMQRAATDLTPMFRWYYKNVLWEAGVSAKSRVLLNLMLHFE